MATTITERPYKHSFSTNEIRYVFQVDDPASAGCAVEVQLYHQENALSAPVLLLTLSPLTPNADGTIRCDVRSYLKSLLKYQLPEVTSVQAVTVITDQVSYFFISFRQVTDAAPDPDWTSDSENIRIVLLGGIEQMKFQHNNFFASYVQQNKPFFTWQPSQRFVFLNQKHYLTILLLKLSDNIAVTVQTFFTDGTSSTSIINHNNLNSDILFRIKTGASDLGLQNINAAKKIHYYNVSVVDGEGVVVANPYRFYIDYRPVYKYWDLLYFNSLGGLDSARIKGTVDWTIETGFDEVEHISYNDALDTDRPQEQFSFANVYKRDQFKGDAGWYRTKLEQEAMIEMFLHPIYEIIDRRWIRVINMKKSHDLRNTADKKWSFPVEWTYGYKDAVFTPKEIMLGASVSTTCSPVIISSVSIPDVRLGHSLNHTVLLFGTAPFILSNWVGPSWLNYAVGEQGVTLTGTPTAAASNITISFTITNCGSSSKNFSDTINVVDGPSLVMVSDLTMSGDGTRVQFFKIGNAIEAGDTFRITIYGHAVSIVAVGGDTVTTIINKLRDAINATIESQWNDQGQAPASGTPGFKPVATSFTTISQIQVKLNEANQATATAF